MVEVLAVTEVETRLMNQVNKRAQFNVDTTRNLAMKKLIAGRSRKTSRRNTILLKMWKKKKVSCL